MEPVGFCDDSSLNYSPVAVILAGWTAYKTDCFLSKLLDCLPEGGFSDFSKLS
jgi:hypothetical protein